VPRIGNDVFIATGAKILGDLTVGDGAVVGANAVVLRSVPARSVAAGVPARIIRQDITTSEVSGWPTAPVRKTELQATTSNGVPRKRARVLFFVESLALGGSEKQSIEVARQLAINGWEVTVGCLRQGGPLKARVGEMGMPLVEFHVGSLLTPAAVTQLLRATLFIRRQRFQVVQANDLYSNLFVIPAAWLARVPIIISSRRDLSHWWWYTPLKRRILHAIQRLSTWVIVNSEAVRRDLIETDGFDPNRIRVVHNGIDVDGYKQQHHGTKTGCFVGLPSAYKLIVMVANMHILVKGHRNLIAAAQTVCREYPNAQFILVGDGQQRAFLEAETRAVGLDDSVIFLGYRTDIPELLSYCDVGVLASTAEGLPNAILEYMAAGLPVVATKVGGVPEVVQDGVSGLLVPPEDSAALAGALLRLLRDEQFAQRLGKAGRQHVTDKFNFNLVLHSLNKIYSEHPPARQSLNRAIGISLSDGQ